MNIFLSWKSGILPAFFHKILKHQNNIHFSKWHFLKIKSPILFRWGTEFLFIYSLKISCCKNRLWQTILILQITLEKLQIIAHCSAHEMNQRWTWRKTNLLCSRFWAYINIQNLGSFDKNPIILHCSLCKWIYLDDLDIHQSL